MSIAGQRVIATSAVRCVGNTLLLNGEVFSPPFRVAAIGPYRTMSSALGRRRESSCSSRPPATTGSGYTVESDATSHVPAYTGSIGLQYAHVGTR